MHCGERTSSSGKEEETTVAIQKGERILFIPFSCCVGTQGLRVGAGGESLPPLSKQRRQNGVSGRVIETKRFEGEIRIFSVHQCVAESNRFADVWDVDNGGD